MPAVIDPFAIDVVFAFRLDIAYIVGDEAAEEAEPPDDVILELMLRRLVEHFLQLTSGRPHTSISGSIISRDFIIIETEFDAIDLLDDIRLEYQKSTFPCSMCPAAAAEPEKKTIIMLVPMAIVAGIRKTSSISGVISAPPPMPKSPVKKPTTNVEICQNTD